MGKNGIFVMLLVAVITLALQPSLVNYSYAGIIVLPEICDDGIDNNGNGLIDLDDPQCSSIILKPVPGALPELPGFDPDPIPLVGDFKCYDAFAPPPLVPVGLEDQFLPLDDRVLDGIEVCNWIQKFAGLGPDNEAFPGSIDPEVPGQHYKVYRLVNNEPIDDDILLKDQWGVTRHTELTPIELWVPQTKLHSNACPPDFDYNPDIDMCVLELTPSSVCLIGNQVGDECHIPPIPEWVFPQQTDIHWKCYDVEPRVPDSPFFVETFDPNFNSEPVTSTVIQLDKICAPVEKTIEGCPDGYSQDGDFCFNSAPPFDNIPFVRTFGDATLDDHLKCYDIVTQDPRFNGENDDVTYVGQFQSDTYREIIEERELCLFATKIHVPGDTPVGGSFIPIDSSALLLLAAQTTASWIIPVLVSAVGIGIVLVRKFSSNKE